MPIHEEVNQENMSSDTTLNQRPGDKLRVVVANPMKEQDRRLVEELEPRVELVIAPDLLPPMRWAADFAGDPAFKLSPEDQRRFDDLVDSAEVLYGIPAVSPEALKRAVSGNKGLRWVQIMAAGGGEMVKRAALTSAELGRVAFTTGAGVHAGPLAEFALFGLLADAKDLPRLQRDRAAKRWPDRWPMRQLADQTIVVAGLGHVGRRVAELLNAFGTRVIGVDLAARDPRDASARGASGDGSAASDVSASSFSLSARGARGASGDGSANHASASSFSRDARAVRDTCGTSAASDPRDASGTTAAREAQRSDGSQADPGLDDGSGGGRARGIVQVVPPEELALACAGADGIVNTLPGTDATYHLIDDAALAALAPGASVVSVGRGTVIDEAALVAALEAGQVGTAVLDVFEHEPLPAASKLWTLPNVIISPHTAANSTAEETALARLFADNASRYLDGRPLLNRVDTVQFF
ncbi:MAG: hypothetical protein LBK95_01905 [Bifidobacteriaceae bacterium]|jgi:phosphoglycerate dehydrogenase-like enzyme|nr:hypothetical protein [Bifidobacteriaceae bacterium]